MRRLMSLFKRHPPHPKEFRIRGEWARCGCLHKDLRRFITYNGHWTSGRSGVGPIRYDEEEIYYCVHCSAQLKDPLSYFLQASQTPWFDGWDGKGDRPERRSS
jgi:hypothetical protein